MERRWRCQCSHEGRVRCGSGGGCRFFLTFEAVGSAFYCWLNGELVGYSQDSCLPAEFDVTSLLQDGDNVLAVQVRRAPVIHPTAPRIGCRNECGGSHVAGFT